MTLVFNLIHTYPLFQQRRRCTRMQPQILWLSLDSLLKSCYEHSETKRNKTKGKDEKNSSFYLTEGTKRWLLQFYRLNTQIKHTRIVWMSVQTLFTKYVHFFSLKAAVKCCTNERRWAKSKSMNKCFEKIALKRNIFTNIDAWPTYLCAKTYAKL